MFFYGKHPYYFRNKATAYTERDMCFTTKGNDLYAIVLNWDKAGVLIKSLDKTTVADAKISWKQTDQGLKLSVPAEKPCEYAYAFKISFDKKAGSHLESEMIDIPFKHGDE